MHAGELTARLRKAYEPPAWAFFSEVGDSTGGRSRSADGLAMSLWPSRGMEVIGFEIKVSRGDWTRELKDPGKSAPIQRFCDRWIVVVPETKIIHEGELPPTWGLVVAHGKGLKTITPAPKLDAEPLTRKFVGAILRAVQKESPTEIQLAQAHEEGRQEGYKQGEQDAIRAADRASKHAQQLIENVAEFEKASGLKIANHHWHEDAKRLGHAVKILMEMVRVHRGPFSNLDYAINNLNTFTAQLKQLRTALDETGLFNVPAEDDGS